MYYKLTEEILKLSVSKYWDRAKFEWHFDSAYESEEKQTCLCGHYPIVNICVIKNKENNSITEVGNCCIIKFLGIDEGNKIFISIKRLRNDITKSMSIEVIEYLKSKNILNAIEFAFYHDVHRKRNLSDKQLEFKTKINKKLLDYTSYEANSQFTRINTVLEWAKNRSGFDLTFIKSLKTSYERVCKLTEKQKIALDNIMNKCKIE